MALFGLKCITGLISNINTSIIIALSLTVLDEV